MMMMSYHIVVIRDRNYKEKGPNGNSGFEKYNWKKNSLVGLNGGFEMAEELANLKIDQ